MPSLQGAGLSVSRFRSAAENVKANGGVTTDRYGNITTLGSGYMVGGVVPSYVVNYTGTDVAYTLAWYAAKHWQELSKDNRYVGAWVEDNTLYLDVSERVEGLKNALGLALYRGELAVWDNAEGTSVYTAALGV